MEYVRKCGGAKEKLIKSNEVKVLQKVLKGQVENL